MDGEREYRSMMSEEERNQMEAVGSAVKKRRRQGVAGQQQRMEHRHRAQSIIQSKALDELETEVFETGLYENVDFSRGSSTGVMVAEIVFSYLWWSILHALPSAVFFYPLCALEISGYEVLCAVWLSPLLLLIGPLRRAVSTPLGLLVLRLLTLVGVASFQGPTTLSRLIILGVGNFFVLLTLTATWWGLSRLDRYRRMYTHLLGYLFMLAIRVWGSSFDPSFSGFTYNNIATGVGVVLALFLYFNDWRTPIVAGNKPPRGDIKYPGLIATGVGFGALLFLTFWIFGDVSVLSRWAVAPYPNRGPYPYPWGLVTMFALTVGLVVFGHQSDLVASRGWLILGLANAMVLYFMESYVAFFGGLELATYAMSLWPLVVNRLVQHHPAKVLAIVAITHIILFLLSVWVVAYNFVPGGWITRERTDVLLAVNVFLTGLATRIVGPKPSRKKQEKNVTIFGQVVRRLSTINESDEEYSGSDAASTGSVHEERMRDVAATEQREHQRFRKKVVRAAAGIFLLALLGFAYRYQPTTTIPEKEHPTVFTAGIWAFHFGYDNQAYPSMERAAQLIENSGVDVIGLLETDAARPYIGNHDIASWLSERLDMYVDYGPGTKDHTWGALILSKYPIVTSEHFLLPSPEGEIAPAVLVSFNISGRIVNIYCVHFGNDVDVLDRKLQAERTAEILSNVSYPVVMISYITNPPGSRDYRRIMDGGNVKDIDPTDKHRWCEYIFYRGLVKLGYARISHGGLSDTEVQVGKFRLPDYPGEPDNEVKTSNPSDVPEWLHFNPVFGSLFHGHFADESRHQFHMGTPKYFKQQ